jgi:ribosomal protein L11 methyltransferase
MWLQLAATVEESLAERVSDWFSAQGALSVSLDDAGDQPLFEPPPGETPLWNLTKVTGLFEADAEVEGLEAAAILAFGEGLVSWSSSVLDDQVWERAWMEHFQPMKFGQRLWICPTGFEPPEPSAINILLDPGLAFGTGTHPTTALCLRWLDSLRWDGQTVLDFGCGSGILAVAALRLGASRAVGVDIDPQALTATYDNALKNGVEDRLQCFAADAAGTLDSFDVVVANILAGPLVDLSQSILSHLRPGGDIALSGILEEQARSVRDAYAPWVDFEADEVIEGWVLLKGRRRS